MSGFVWHIDDIQLASGGKTPGRLAAYSTLFVEGGPWRGGLGETWRARTAAGEEVACKRMLMPERANFAMEEAYQAEVDRRRAAFDEEYAALCRLSSFKGFVKARAYGQVEGAPAIVMEWVQGVALSDADLRGMTDAMATAQLARDVFALLARLEQQAELFVHRDLSPANIMVRTSAASLEEQMARGSFDICLIDFGSAATMRTGDGSFTTDTSILRGATPAYAPPEMLTSDIPRLDELRASPSIDVYAACSVFYELLCWHPPFVLGAQDGIGSDYVRKMVLDPLPTAFEEGSPDAVLTEIFCNGIRAAQEDRPTAGRVHAALEAFCASGGREATPVAPSADLGVPGAMPDDDAVPVTTALKAPTPAGKRRGGTAALAVAAFAAMLALGAVLALGGSGGQDASAGQVDSASTAESAASTEDTVAAEASADSGASPLAGAWTGTLESTSTDPACYGAREHPMELTVTEGDNGSLTCDVRVLFHAHNRRLQSGDANANASDTVQSWEGLSATPAGEGFTLWVDESTAMGRDSSLTVLVAPDDAGALKATVTSRFLGAETVDVYALE